ncbi:MAG: CDP-glycerol:poly(glycerophosphate) glycerophosphotransferase [Hyphomicrobiales bacterium]|nr:CDP-glycerol:poly(glycerophosphate) glycerophosphotransferase [Hyphomicrobiales bacterium]
MSKVVSNPKAVEALFDHYTERMNAFFFHPVTGSPIELPAGFDRLTVAASLLNIHLYDPEIVIVWNNKFHLHHLTIWAPYIRESKHRIAIVCRSMKEMEVVEKLLPNTPVWALDKNIFAFQQLPLAPSLKVFLYPDNDRMNEHTIHNYPRHTHVHIGHGDSDKSTSANRFGAIYDYIFVADQRAIQRFRSAGIEIPDHQFIPIGAPTIPGLKVSANLAAPARVLYAPTWEGTSATKNFSSIEHMLPHVQRYDATHPGGIRVRPHPFLGGRDAVYGKLVRNFSKWFVAADEKAAQFAASDILLSDVSGVLSEYLFTGQPVAIPVSSEDEWLNAYLQNTDLLEYVYRWNFDKLGLEAFLEQISADPLRPARLKRRDSLYAHAQNFADSLQMFDRALDTVMLNHFWRARRAGAPPSQSTRSDASGPWSELVRQIRAGQKTLGA